MAYTYTPEIEVKSAPISEEFDIDEWVKSQRALRKVYEKKFFDPQGNQLKSVNMDLVSLAPVPPPEPKTLNIAFSADPRIQRLLNERGNK